MEEAWYLFRYGHQRCHEYEAAAGEEEGQKPQAWARSESAETGTPHLTEECENVSHA